MLKIVLLAFLLLVAFSIDTATSNNSIEKTADFFQEFPNSEVLDDNGDVILKWLVDEDSGQIWFEIYAKTFGYVGFGISPTGSMKGADIFIAGVFENGTSYHSDRHGTGFETPKIDAHADWFLQEAREMYSADFNGTYLKFSRYLDTCDTEDYPIGVDTNRLIWAMGETDDVTYHGATKRGTRSISLLGAPMPQLGDENVFMWNMTIEMVMPKEYTTYWCTFHRGPKLDRKHQIVAFDAVLPNAAALQHTHHFILYNCYKDPTSDIPLEDIFGNYTVDSGYMGEYCHKPYVEGEPTPLERYCVEYLYVWAKGGKKMVFPEHVGYPIGEEGEGSGHFYMLDIHYDNPEEKEGVKFETGVTFYYTDKIREMDASQLMVGHEVSPSLLVPPNTSDFVVAGHCGGECTNSSLFPEDGITVFNILLHSHLSGRALKIRHFRDGVELPWPVFDNHYDFDYQQNKHLTKEFKVLKGDHLTYECTYDSVWKNGSVVIGQLSTRDEMCDAFLWYYPKMPLDACGSQYDVDQSMADLGITEFENVSPPTGMRKIYIKKPLELEGDYEESLSTKYNWTREFINELEETRRFGEHEAFCYERKSVDRIVFQVKYPTIEEIYQPEDFCAGTSSSTISSTSEDTGKDSASFNFVSVHVLSAVVIAQIVH